MKKLSAMKRVLKRTGAFKMLISFLTAMCITAFLIMIAEPKINTFGDALWYCYVATTTIGFGDVCVQTGIGRVLTVFISIYGIMAVAMIPGIVVSYYLDYLKLRDKEILSGYREKLEMLHELDKEELKEISDKIKKL